MDFRIYLMFLGAPDHRLRLCGGHFWLLQDRFEPSGTLVIDRNQMGGPLISAALLRDEDHRQAKRQSRQ
jgi:hypothetical protein